MTAAPVGGAMAAPTCDVIALDVGGTAMKGAIVPAGLAVNHEAAALASIAYSSWDTPRLDGPDAVIARVLTVIDELRQRAPGAAAVGLVVPGVVDDAAGVAVDSENIGWRDVPFRQLVQDRTGLPVAFGHDVRSGGLAERAIGAGQGVDNLLVMPIGTGIAGAMFIGGRQVTNPYAGEIGHINTGFDVDCVCGCHGCLEAVASAAAMARRFTEASGIDVRGAKEVQDYLESGDPIAARVWDDALTALTRALATYATLIAPDRVVIGGGLARAGEELLFRPIRDGLRRLLTWQKMPEIVPATLGDKAGCLGAALIAGRLATS